MKRRRKDTIHYKNAGTSTTLNSVKLNDVSPVSWVRNPAISPGIDPKGFIIDVPSKSGNDNSNGLMLLGSSSPRSTLRTFESALENGVSPEQSAIGLALSKKSSSIAKKYAEDKGFREPDNTPTTWENQIYKH